MIATVVLISPRAVVIYMIGSDNGEPDGDAVFPGWDKSRWRRVSTEYRNGLAFCEYRRLGHSRA